MGGQNRRWHHGGFDAGCRKNRQGYGQGALAKPGNVVNGGYSFLVCHSFFFTDKAAGSAKACCSTSLALSGCFFVA
jgi:hypothetical protein